MSGTGKHNHANPTEDDSHTDTHTAAANRTKAKFVTRKLGANEVPKKKTRPPLNDLHVPATAPASSEQQSVDLVVQQFEQSLRTMPAEKREARPVSANRRRAGSNWNAVRSSSTHSNGNNENEPAPHSANNEATTKDSESSATEAGAAPPSKAARLRQRRKANQANRYVAMDCEMVGTGTGGMFDVLARVSIVNKAGEVLLDKYVKPTEPVTDYRTYVSGIRPHNIADAEEFSTVQAEVIKLLQGKVLVGHAVHNDLSVLEIRHPPANIRDTSRYKHLNRIVSHGRTPSLKHLSRAILGRDIQTGEHDSVEDARATMQIYNTVGKEWEKHINSQRSQHPHNGPKTHK